MKKIFIFALAAAAMASCTNDDFLGEGQGQALEEGQNGAILFTTAGGQKTQKGTKRKVGANITGKAAGDILKHFYVLGTKGTEEPTTSPTTTIVFDNYKVSYGINTAGTTASNTDDWEYVGITPTGLHAGTNALSEQSIKYWDYSASQYDFIAYSVGANTLATTGDAAANSVVGSAIKTPTTDAATSFTLKVASVDDLKECYFTDVTEVLNGAYGQPVTLKFKNLAAKVRVAFYETIPGYSVSNIEFYQDETTFLNADIHENTNATLIGSGFATAGTVTVTYPKVGTTNESNNGYDKAYATVASSGTNATVQRFGAVNYGNAKTITGASANYIGETASNASMAGTAGDSYYTAVFPVSSSNALTLRVNYTLTSNDGSKETIKVYGAKAIVPATYTQWQPNYAYTYIFKISDNTNGWTSAANAASGDNNKVGLFPITFDAVVAAIDDVDFNQETITTVATPSVTTYAFDATANSNKGAVVKAYGASGNEYKAATTTDIYVSVQDASDISSGIVYKVTGATNKVPATEANVIDALQMGRNALTLTAATGSEAAVYTTESIPTEDGKGITVAAKSVAKFTATATATTYAFVYKVSDGTASYLYTAVEGDGTTEAGENEYYTDHTGTSAIVAGEVLASGTTYYKKITNNNNVYAVKVIKTY